MKGRPEEAYVHIPKILYHWRCHRNSTASNPASKTYAYEAGRRALEDFGREHGWKVQAEDTTGTWAFTAWSLCRTRSASAVIWALSPAPSLPEMAVW